MINNAFKALIDYLDGKENPWAYYDALDIGALGEMHKDFTTASNKQNALGVALTDGIINQLYDKFRVTGKDRKIPIDADNLLKILKQHASKVGQYELDAFATQHKNYQLVRTLREFNKHLQEGGEKKDLPALLAAYSKNMAKVNRDFYTTTIDSDPKLGKVVEDILTTVGITDARVRGRYINAPVEVRQFLKEVVAHHNTPNNKEQLEQIKAFNQIVLDKSRVSRQKALLYGLLGILPIVGGMSYNGFGAVEQIVTAALFVPVVGIVGAVAAGAYAIYENLTRKNVHWMDQLRDNALVVAGTALKISAYSLAIAAAVTAAPVIAILTTVAAGVGVIREGAKLISLYSKKSKEVGSDLQAQQNQARMDDKIAKTKKTVWLRFGVAVALTGLAAAACFAPGGIFVVAGAALGVAIVSFFQWRAEKAIEKSTTDLNAKFKELENADAAASEESNSPQVVEELTSDAKATIGLRARDEHSAPSAVEVADEHIAPAVSNPRRDSVEEPVLPVADRRPAPLQMHGVTKQDSDDGYVSPLSKEALKGLISPQTPHQTATKVDDDEDNVSGPSGHH